MQNEEAVGRPDRVPRHARVAGSKSSLASANRPIERSRLTGWREGCTSIGLSTQQDQNTCSDCEDGHESPERRKAEIQQWYQPRQDEPDAQQEHAEILGQFH
jgi:hypothetical protein